jgi:hypothetical protein
MEMSFDTWIRVCHEIYASSKLSIHFHGIKAGAKIKIITHPSSQKKKSLGTFSLG